MQLTEHSRNRILNTFYEWTVPREFAEPMYNYMVHGFHPGGCFTSVLANDFHGSIMSSHPANTIVAFKSLTGWIHNIMPEQAYGSYEAVSNWCKLDTAARRLILEAKPLIYTEEEEIMLILQNRYTSEPMLD